MLLCDSMSRNRSILALLLLVPAPSLGVLAAMVVFPNSPIGTVLFGLSKVWLFGLPLFWTLFIDRRPLSLSPVRHGGFGVGVLSGVLISLFMLVFYRLLGPRMIDASFLAEKLNDIGLGRPGVYAAGAAYWILVNSVLEEYVWRWFCVRQCEALMKPGWAVVASALFFTLHHVVALRVYFYPVTVILCSLGVFLGGVIWSWMYIRFRSIWPGYVSHALVDLCVFGIGASLLFGVPW